MKRLILSLILALSAFSVAASFQGLGAGSLANDVSADGSVVVGSGRWTQTGGWQDIAATATATATACSADGSVIVGYKKDVFWLGNTGYGYTIPTYWTAEGGLVELSSSPAEKAVATDVSDDGAKVVGYVTENHLGWGFGFPTPEAFIYEFDTGRTMLGDLADAQGLDTPGCYSVANAISGDGTVLVGGATELSNVASPMHWTESGGMDKLTLSPETNWFGSVMGISQDGSRMIGYGSTVMAWTKDSFYWTEDTGIQMLGKLDGFDGSSCPLAMTDDLSTIVGWAYGNSEYAAFLWNDSLGMIKLQEYLQDIYTMDLDGWTLTEATGISADGFTIIGNGINPDGLEEAWIATIPEPASIMLLALGVCCIRKRK